MQTSRDVYARLSGSAWTASIRFVLLPVFDLSEFMEQKVRAIRLLELTVNINALNSGEVAGISPSQPSRNDFASRFGNANFEIENIIINFYPLIGSLKVQNCAEAT